MMRLSDRRANSIVPFLTLVVAVAGLIAVFAFVWWLNGRANNLYSGFFAQTSTTSSLGSLSTLGAGASFPLPDWRYFLVMVVVVVAITGASIWYWGRNERRSESEDHSV
jgi:multidrug resistance efflux pump